MALLDFLFGKPPKAPDPIDPAKAQGEYLFGKRFSTDYQGVTDPDLQRRWIEAEGEFRPQWNELNLLDMNQSLFGVGEGEGILDMQRRAAVHAEETRASTTSSQREADIRDVEGLGTRATEALRASDPETAALLERQSQIGDDLYARSQGVTPQQQREMEQQVRAGYASRGRIGDNASIWGEVMGRENVLRGNRAEYQQHAGQTFGMLQQTAADPFQAILGRPASAPGMGMQLGQQAQGLLGTSQSQLFDGDAGVNLALAHQKNLGDYNASVYGAQMGVVGSALGAAGAAYGKTG